VFDDAMVKEISRDWNDVPPRCTIGKFQPSLLFYEREDEVSPVTLTPPKIFNSSISSSIDALSNQAISNYTASYSKPITSNTNKPLTTSNKSLTSSSNSIYNTSPNKSITSNTLTTNNIYNTSNSIYNTDKSNGNTSLNNSKTSDTSLSYSSINSTSTSSKDTTPDREYTIYPSPSISESASNYVTSNSIVSNPVETHYGYYPLHSKSYTNTSEASNTKSLSSSSKTSQDSDSIKKLKRSNSLLDSTNEDIKKLQQSSSQVLDPFMTWAHNNPPPVSERIKQIEER
jgi:hypothetical protein